MLEFAEVSIGRGGLPSCVRCHPAPQPPRFASDAEIAEALRGVAGVNVTFADAEPFAHPHLPQLIRLAVSAGMQRIRLRTDAGALASPNNAAGVIAAGVRQIEVVLLAGEAGAGDALSGRPGLFAAALAGISAFTEAARAVGARVAVLGRVPVCRHSEAGVASAVEVLASAGAVSIDLVAAPGHELGRGTLDAARDAAMVHGAWVRHPGGGTAIEPWAGAGETA